MRYCSRCTYPEIAINLMIDDEGICSACRAYEDGEHITDEEWTEREEKLKILLEDTHSRSHGGYDCIIPVGGGKDSYWQTYLIKEVYGLTPLLVTYHGYNFLPEGQSNLDRMRDEFDVDHLQMGPSVKTLRKLNRVCFKRMGDMNWHAHAGISIFPIIMAVKLNIPLVIWGEIGWDISGMFSPNDFSEYSKRVVYEHDLRGFNWQDMVGEEGLTEKDFNWMKMPSDEDLAELGVRGIYIGNYIKWNPNSQTKKMIENYGFEIARQPFERTYRVMSNLDDMHENGIHDYMKYIKFGYGRASDHSSKDIRAGYMTRSEGIEMVRKYDHVKPYSDLKRWLEYVEMTEQEFDEISDNFRDPRVWSKNHRGAWIKDNIWDN